MKLEPIIDLSEFIDNYWMLKKLDYSDITPEICLSKCLTGEYCGMIAKKRGEKVGIVIYRYYETFAWVVGIYCVNNLKGFPEMFWAVLKKSGVKKVRCSTTRDGKAYSKLMDMKILWTVLEKEL